MRDNAGENKSQEIVDFFESMGIKKYYSTAHEQWQKGLPEVVAYQEQSWWTLGPGLEGRFWFKSAMAGCDARNVTHKEGISTTP